MIVMGGIVGSGIFINPYVVALHVHTPFLILGVWVLGGVLALLGGFIWAELATRLPQAGGQYLYLREAYHPSVAFLYGWVLLLVTQTGGMAAVAVTFARYFREISGVTTSDGAIAAIILVGLTAINCFGARAGSNVQSLLMLLKSAAIIAMVVLGLALGGGHIHARPLLDRPPSLSLVGAIGAAMIPIAFAYGGWQTATFVAGEMRDPQRELSRGLIAGVLLGVVVALSFCEFRLLACARSRWARRNSNTCDRRHARCTQETAEHFGSPWESRSGRSAFSARALSRGRACTTRWRATGYFSKAWGWLSPKTGAPVVAIVVQGIAATVIALSGRYEQILNYVVSIDFISFALTAASLFVEVSAAATRLSSRDAEAELYRVPGHPYTTALFVLTCVAIVTSTIVTYPTNSAFGFVILAAGIPCIFVLEPQITRIAPSTSH